MVGKFKDETAGKKITELVGLRPKMYSYTEHGAGRRKAGLAPPPEGHRASDLEAAETPGLPGSAPSSAGESVTESANRLQAA